ncbi:MAG: helix-turn-helix domain-containing protein [Sporichthyaceae bacterium]|nr:helix-turn-helix domain-containing protein [Sporichthyaceae bacterium]
MTSHPAEADVHRQLRPEISPRDGIDVDRLANLPPVMDLMDAAALLGQGRTTAYKLVRNGEWPTPVIRIGRLIKIPTAPLRDCCVAQLRPHRMCRPSARVRA